MNIDTLINNIKYDIPLKEDKRKNKLWILKYKYKKFNNEGLCNMSR